MLHLIVAGVGIVAGRPGKVGPAHVDGAAGETGRVIEIGVVEEDGVRGSVVFNPGDGGIV